MSVAPLKVTNKSSHNLKISTSLGDIVVPSGQTVPVVTTILEIVIQDSP